jgi:hypothetical protein
MTEPSYDPTSLEGVPEAGRARLEQNRQFTSDLSVNEFLLVRQAGFEPLGLVVGQLDLPHRLPAGELEAARRWTCSRRRCTTRASSR